jgi:dTDP-3,4-didehydro-2,6-dideoxy-alpha-D-glucose 3-reductase
MNKYEINIGILGASEIAPRALIDPSKRIPGVRIHAIASRNDEKAKAFSQKYNIPKYYNSYEKLLNDQHVDAVYISLVSGLHAEWAVKALHSGKHVLVEKPVCFTSEEIQQLRQAQEKKKDLYLLEGLMVQHHPWIGHLEKVVTGKEYGELISIGTNMAYTIDDDTDFRLHPELGGSVFYEEGILWSFLLQRLVGLDPARSHIDCSFNGPYGGDHTVNVKLNFKNNVTSDLFCSYAHPYASNHIIDFEDAVLEINNFWRPTFGFVKLKMNVKIKSTSEIINISFEPGNYFYSQLKHFIEAINNYSLRIDLNQSFQRIGFLEKLYKMGRNG